MFNRRWMIRRIAGSSLPFKIKDGSFKFSSSGNSPLVISGGVIEFTTKVEIAYGSYAYLNISDLNQNTSNQSSTENINNKPAIFTIPDGAECVLSTGAYSTNASASHANASIKLVMAGGSEYIAQTPAIRVGPQSVSWVQDGDASVGCIAMVIHNTNWNGWYKNMTVSLTVNGETWV